ncbi:ImmA/IrrE family metallo-endopeptidase [Clostridium butyricum]|uniref:Uncharacterized protein n=1 Tax=Clostridium butyricum TaxID=1492 RepID=A0A2S7FDB7_CLOBU|nr:hypothetical protein [Clostridium butyricum]KHD16017.1 hypothetical protein OA81_07030 [Clostridium butyricum]PPV16562.1 hypothetical protein AWN73_09845 [Clostridium butyricum]
MNIIFNSGFTEKSWFNIFKQIAEGLYEQAIKAPSNTNIEYKTKGLKFNYIEDDKVNACAWIYDNYDNIQINTGTLIKIFSLFYTAFSNRDIYKNIGNSQLESNEIIKGDFDPDKIELLFSGIPKDEDRVTIANLMSLFAFRYIFAHELGHLLNGHSYLLKTLYGTEHIDMILKDVLSKFSERKNEEYALDRRTLEMDADAFAATFSINNLIGLYQQQEKNGWYFDLLDNPIQIFELWAFAIHTIFMLFESSVPSNYDKLNFYLPNEARQILNLSAAESTIDGMRERGSFKCTDIEKKKIISAFTEGISKAEYFFNNTFNTKFNFIIKVSTSSEYQDYANGVGKHWNNNLRFKLKKYARCILYDPNGMEF